MFELVQDYGVLVDAAGRAYKARAYGEPQLDGSWDAWLVFFPIGAGTAIATDRETTQNSIADLVHWASTIGAVYLQGALERALELEPSASIRASIVTRLAELALLDSQLEKDAALLETAADRARAESEAAAQAAAVHETAASVARAEALERAEDAIALERDAVLIDDEATSEAPAPARARKPRSQAADASKRRRKK